MTLFTYISQNINRVKFDIRIGLIPCSILKHFQVYSRYDYYRRLGNSVSSSVNLTGIDLEVADSWVYSIINKMEKEI
jgi:hypothetical protein